MQHRALGSSGIDVSVVGLGCNNFGTRINDVAVDRVIGTAIDMGINLFDTADIYGGKGGSEAAIGDCLGARRQKIILATKFGLPMDESGQMQGGSRRYIMFAVEQSLRRLRTDWIDLYQHHSPDEATPVEETLRALDDLIQQGKVRHIGSSNLTASQVTGADSVARSMHFSRFVTCQSEYNLLARGAEAELIPTIRSHGIGLLPYFPLANGLLTGKYALGRPAPVGSRLASKELAARFMTDAKLIKVRKLQEFCEQRGKTLLELAFSWLVANPVVSSVIAGATTPEQVKLNARAAGWQLSTAEFAEIDTLLA